MCSIGLTTRLPLMQVLPKKWRCDIFQAPGNDAEMAKIVICILLSMVGLLSFCFFPPSLSKAQTVANGITSEHVLMRLPLERESLGRELIADIERCYLFMNAATGDKLPRKVVLIVDWNQTETSCNRQEAKILVGMNWRAAAANPSGFLMHDAAREMARLGLLQISDGAEREDNAFLFEGMVEILTSEYLHTSRKFEAAWVIAQSLDQMGKLGMANQRSWTDFSQSRRTFRNAAPGITFLSAMRDLQGRDKPLKFFESLKKASLIASLAAVFKSPVSELESVWLKKVREYRAPEEITTAEADVPQLVRTILAPEEGRPGSSIEIQLFLKDAADNLLPDGVFLKDVRTSRVMQAISPSQKNSEYMIVAIPVDANCLPGKYDYLVTAVDESGNVRRWNGSYRVGLAP
jgi:hypothetical protein